ncbi:MAG: sulfatase-like hydrolase/transferase [Bacteroidales bacterium]|nr:sulfatase-like hydrolase/transferase [Bacteroidales bacterium]
MSNKLQLSPKSVAVWLGISLGIFAILILVRWSIYYSIPISSLWHNPTYFISFYIPRLILALYVGSLYFVISGKVRLFQNKPATGFVLLVALCLLLQCAIFTLFMYHSVKLEWASLCITIGLCLLVASLAYLVKHKRLFAVVILMCNFLWIEAEMIYYRANGFFLDGLSIYLISNLDGFWSSIPGYVYWYDITLLLPLLGLFIILKCVHIFERLHDRQFCDFLFILGCCMLVDVVCCMRLHYKHFSSIHQPCPKVYKFVYNPFSADALGMMTTADKTEYIYIFSVMHAFFYDVRECIELTTHEDKVDLTAQELTTINQRLKPIQPIIPTTPLIIVLVESLETWCISPEVTPNLYKFISEHDNVLYALDVEAQRKAGSSADGQFIVNTGMLPVNVGTVAFRYCYNEYPSLSDCYTKSCGVFPQGLAVWNQKQMSDAYSIDTNFVATEEDVTLFNVVVEKAHQYNYVLTLTMSSHTPFVDWADASKLKTPNDMPTLMANYLKCIHLMDNGLNVLLSQIDTDPYLEGTTIMITGDHNIFNEAERQQFRKYVQHKKLSFDMSLENCPVIIYSPNIHDRKVEHRSLYQMDIYPTILNLIGGENYYWQGFGINMLDSSDVADRDVDPHVASYLSDKMIRMDFFRKYN